MKYIFKIIVVLIGISAQAQLKSSSEIYHDIEKLEVLGSVLYVAAHPDDENTRLISYLVNNKKYKTAYLSLTRGDGGQNLIGPEKGAQLGLIRTQELLEARKRDGANQYFSRAVDFGYSKSADETFEKWNREEVLSDVVWVIRNFKPDVIITRFPPDKRAGHGHHTASGMLAEEAFKMAGDKNAFQEQLKYVGVWNPNSIYLNTSSWINKELPELAKTKQEYMAVDVGTWDPKLGKWHNEIAAISRSQHKSQGFGVSRWKGEMIEYLKHTDGNMFSNELFDNLDISWKGIEGGNEIARMILEIKSTFNINNPAASVVELIDLYKALGKIDHYWAKIKREEVKAIIKDCLGLWIDAISANENVLSGTENEFTFSFTNGSIDDVSLKGIQLESFDTSMTLNLGNTTVSITKMIDVLNDKMISQPYWLKGAYGNMFQVNDQKLIGKPQNDPSLIAQIKLDVMGEIIVYGIPVEYKWTDRVKGEQRLPVSIVPAFTANFSNDVLLIENEKKIGVKVHSFKMGNVDLSLNAPSNWNVSPEKIELQFDEVNIDKVVEFTLTPPNEKSEGKLTAFLEYDGLKTSHSYQFIDYDHITSQKVYNKAEVKIVKANLKNDVKKVGYILGAGDNVPDCLNEIGIEVSFIDLKNVATVDLNQFDAVIAGVRTYNTQEEIKSAEPIILEYVKNGGNYIVQYNTSRSPYKVPGPYKLKLSRDRVTDEFSEVRMIDNKHTVFNYPNKITNEDFNDWVQERGLYFPNEWGNEFTPLIGWNDDGEDEKTGALLVSNYGDGTFIYTGISFFRQLPAGVPGAYRLFTNLLNYSKE